jgi:hypothetical protein
MVQALRVAPCCVERPSVDCALRPASDHRDLLLGRVSMIPARAAGQQRQRQRPAARSITCVSTDAGLDQDFNSLDGRHGLVTSRFIRAGLLCPPRTRLGRMALAHSTR